MELIKKTFEANAETKFDCYIFEIQNRQTAKKEFWFKAKDIAQFLGYAIPRKAIRDHVPEKYRRIFEDFARGLSQTHYSSLHPHTVFISEPGLYALILRSKLPIATKFCDWVFEEVLPSIRESGAYALSREQSNQLMELCKRNQRLCDTNQRLCDDNHKLCAEVLDMKPRVAVMPETDEKKHVLEVYQKGNSYIFIRPQKCKLKIARKSKRLEGYIRIYFKCKVPNSMNILNKIKEYLLLHNVSYVARKNEIITNANVLDMLEEILK